MSYCCTENFLTDEEVCTLRQYQWQFERSLAERENTRNIRIWQQVMAASILRTKEAMAANLMSQGFGGGMVRSFYEEGELQLQFIPEYEYRTYGLASVVDSQGLKWRKNKHGNWNIVDE